MTYLVTFQELGAESSISGGPFECSHSTVNFTVRQCTVEADDEDMARDIVNGYNDALRYEIENGNCAPTGLIEILKVEVLP